MDVETLEIKAAPAFGK